MRAWWRDSAKDLAGLTARKSGSHVSNLLGLVVQSVFLDERNGQPCALLYSRLQRPAEPPPHSDEAAEQQRFFVDNFDLAALRVHEVLFDVDRIAELTADDVRCAAQDGAGTHGLTITGQVQCLRIRIQPGKLDRVREYCAALPTRDGLRDVLRDEGVLIETMCLDHTDDADYLLFYSRVENLKASGETFRQSRHLIDEEARTFMAETWELHGGVSRLEMIYDVDRIADIVDGS